MYATISNVLQSNSGGDRVGWETPVRRCVEVQKSCKLTFSEAWFVDEELRLCSVCLRDANDVDVNKLILLQEISSSVCVYILCARFFFFFQIHFFRGVERERV